MEYLYIAAAVIGAAGIAVGGFFSVYQLYLLVQVDAKCRGLKRPRMWGLLSAAANNSSGLLLYLVVRRKYPVLSRSAEQARFMERCKQKIGVGFVFLAAGAILCVLGLLLGTQL